MTQFGYEILLNKKWRAISYDFEALYNYGDTSRLYCLTDFQVGWLLSNTDYFAWTNRWKNCPCTQNDMLALKAELEYNLMNCVDIQPYQIQYLYDQQQTVELQQLQTLWDATMTPSGVNPLTPDDFYSGNGSLDRRTALCTACKIYVYSYAQNWISKAQIALGLAALVGIAASITIVGGIIASVLIGGLALITTTALSAMQDTDALDAVACCMFSALDGAVISQAIFTTCLDACGFTVGSNEAIVRDIIDSDIAQFQNWLSFINQVGNSYEYAQNGIIDCPCTVEQTYYLEADFTVSQKGWYVSQTDRGLYSAGVGWINQDLVDSSATYIAYDFTGSYKIEILEARYSYSSGGDQGFKRARLYNDGTIIYSENIENDNTVVYPGTLQLVAPGYPTLDQLEFRLNCSNGTGTFLIDRARLQLTSSIVPQEFYDNGWTDYTP